ncbi:Response regulator receiver domain-containing protein [Treponema bryantii]|uniref:Response regulator receiver domain-containing protein n=1 Tax=Treponema bryantii TaxID=163 RepID=A0A1I3IYS1_9SPIR|nr:response regulator transcription factor [Treponema bryantii]SFI53137.1 Response regulator receiver domain-containing protein [Treponema bryantii]
MIDELYIVGDQSRLVVKNLINQFKATECKVNVYYPTGSDVDRLPNFSIQLLVLLSDDIEFDVIRKIVIYQKKYDYHLCFIGKMTTLSLEDNRFFKQIPSIKIESYTVNIEKVLELMEKNSSDKKHILVVDDEPIILRSIKVWLGDDFHLSLVSSGEMALQFLDMHPVDLVLLDYKMPTMDGPKVLEAIRSDERLNNLPVIFLTANNDRQSVLNAMQLKPDGYILKSKAPDEIKAAVVDFFKNRIIKA